MATNVGVHFYCLLNASPDSWAASESVSLFSSLILKQLYAFFHPEFLPLFCIFSPHSVIHSQGI